MSVSDREEGGRERGVGIWEREEGRREREEGRINGLAFLVE